MRNIRTFPSTNVWVSASQLESIVAIMIHLLRAYGVYQPTKNWVLYRTRIFSALSNDERKTFFLLRPTT